MMCATRSSRLVPTPDSSEQPPSVADFGEFALLERFRSALPAAPHGEIWSGDDAAVVTPGAGKAVVTTDALVDGVDFDLSYAAGADVGWKAMAANVSDLAAMAASPGPAVVALCLPSATPVSLVDGLLEGLRAASDRWGVALVGGDLSEAPTLMLAVTLIGWADRPLLRSGARPGDAIFVTGSLGGAAGGLEVLRRGLSGVPAGALVRRQLRPEARLEEARALATTGSVTAMIDVSDGWVRDLGHLLSASAVGCDVDPSLIPVDPALREVDLDVDPLELALTGGEDFELLFTASADGLEELGPATGGVTRIGTVTESEATIGGRSLDAWRDQGWEHLRDR